MRKILLMSVIFLLSCTVSLQLSAQILNIYNVDPSSYPNVRVTYSFEDSDGKDIRSGIDKTNIMVTETLNSVTIERDKDDPVCEPPDSKGVSVVIVLDLSQSMSKGIKGSGTPTDPYSGKSRFEVAELASILDWIRNMNPYETEVAIIGFAAQGYVIHKYSTDKPSLEEAVNKLNLTDVIGVVGNGTNYNAALLWQTDHQTNNMYYDENSALHFCKPSVAKYSPSIIFLTDGSHQSDVKRTYDTNGVLVGKVLLGEINTLAKERNAHIFNLQIGGTIIDGSSISTLMYLASINGGSPSKNLKLRLDDEEQLLNTYRDIYDEVAKVGTPPKCYFDYITDCDGGGVLDVIMDYSGNPASASTTFSIPEEIKPLLELSQTDILIESKNSAINDTVSNIVVKALRNDIYISGYTSTNPKFSIINLPSVILANNEASCKLVYNAAGEDPLTKESEINFLSNACSTQTIHAVWKLYSSVKDDDLVGRVNAFPNPFSKSTVIKYTLRQSAYVSIDIYNAVGSKVANIQEGFQTEGNHHADFEAGNLSPGVYYYVARAGSNVLSGKVVLIK